MDTRTLIVASGLVAILTLWLAACGDSEIETKLLTGSIEVVGDTCSELSTGYSDVPGSQVIVRDESGTLLGSGSVERTGTTHDVGGSQSCTFDFTARSIPGGAKFYSVEIGRRGELVYTAEELDLYDWELNLSLGD